MSHMEKLAWGREENQERGRMKKGEKASVTTHANMMAEHRQRVCEKAFFHLPVYLWEVQISKLVSEYTSLIKVWVAASSLLCLNLFAVKNSERRRKREGDGFVPDRKTVFQAK